jgi:hypothetical protein
MSFEAQVRVVERYLRGAGIRFLFEPRPSPVPAALRTLSYLEQWRQLLANGWYSYRLEDHSLLLFLDGPSFSFSYIECPVPALSIRDFAAGLGVGGGGREAYSSDVQMEYELYLDTLEEKSHVTPMRLDHDPVGFDELSHPLSHIHIGLDNQIRIGTSRIWSPTSFVLFVLRQRYPDNWRILLRTNLVGTLQRRVRIGLTEIAAPHFNLADCKEAFLG